LEEVDRVGSSFNYFVYLSCTDDLIYESTNIGTLVDSEPISDCTEETAGDVFISPHCPLPCHLLFHIVLLDFGSPCWSDIGSHQASRPGPAYRSASWPQRSERLSEAEGTPFPMTLQIS